MVWYGMVRYGKNLHSAIKCILFSTPSLQFDSFSQFLSLCVPIICFEIALRNNSCNSLRDSLSLCMVFFIDLMQMKSIFK